MLMTLPHCMLMTFAGGGYFRLGMLMTLPHGMLMTMSCAYRPSFQAIYI
jgi:hypothetical protein